MYKDFFNIFDVQKISQWTLTSIIHNRLEVYKMYISDYHHHFEILWMRVLVAWHEQILLVSEHAHLIVLSWVKPYLSVEKLFSIKVFHNLSHFNMFVTIYIIKLTLYSVAFILRTPARTVFHKARFITELLIFSYTILYPFLNIDLLRFITFRYLIIDDKYIILCITFKWDLHSNKKFG